MRILNACNATFGCGSHIEHQNWLNFFSRNKSRADESLRRSKNSSCISGSYATFNEIENGLRAWLASSWFSSGKYHSNCVQRDSRSVIISNLRSESNSFCFKIVWSLSNIAIFPEHAFRRQFFSFATEDWTLSWTCIVCWFVCFAVSNSKNSDTRRCLPKKRVDAASLLHLSRRGNPFFLGFPKTPQFYFSSHKHDWGHFLSTTSARQYETGELHDPSSYLCKVLWIDGYSELRI